VTEAALLNSIDVRYEDRWFCWRLLLPTWHELWAPDEALRMQIVNAFGSQRAEEEFNWSAVWLHPADLDEFWRASLDWLDRQVEIALGQTAEGPSRRQAPRALGRRLASYAGVPAWAEQGYAYLQPAIFTRSVPVFSLRRQAI